MNKFIVIIRPEFMQFCNDACKAATLNHLLFRIAGKCKDQPKEDIQAGKVLWYGSNEQITREMSDAWGVCKVRKEINELVKIGLFGRTTNPTWGVDRTKHFYFSEKECAVFLRLCEENKICFVHLDLPDEVKHLIYSSNANDKSIKCICLNHQMQPIDISDASDKYIEAITKIDYKDIHKDNNKEESTIVNSANAEVDAPAPIDFIEQKQKRDTDPRIPAITLKGQANNGNHHHSGNSDLRRSGDGLPDSIGDGSEERRRDGLAADIGGHATPAAQAATESQLAQHQTTSTSDSGTTPVQRSEVLPPGTPASLGAAQGGKSSTKEIQRRINAHRGYALEEKTDKIREATAIKTWCNLHTIEEYEQVMEYLTTKDKYWKLEENKYRIGGLTLAKETPKALASLKKPQSNGPALGGYYMIGEAM